MATFNNGEAGLSVRTKLNNVMQHADGTPSTLTFNDAGADVDVRIEGVGQTHAFFLDAGTSNIGIGTSTASSKLTVAGDANVAGIATAIAMRDSTNRRITSPGGGSYTTTSATVNGAIAITLPVGYTNHMMKMKISVYEYVSQESFDIIVGGYNSTSPSWINCSAAIISNNSTDLDYTVRFGFNATTSRCVIYIGELGTAWSYPQVNITDVQLGYTTTGLDAWDDGWSIGFETSAFQNVTQTLTNNRVGARLIGNGQTTAALTDAGARGNLLRLSSLGNTAGVGGGIVFTSAQSDTVNSLGMAAIKSLLVSNATNTTGDLTFSTRNAATDTNLTERMRITSTGNLGIGTTTPAYRLDVGGSDIRLANNATYIRSVTTLGADVRMLGINASNIAYVGPIDPGPVSTLYSVANTSTIAAFYTSANERMRIDASGNVGIGTTSPIAALDVSGAINSRADGSSVSVYLAANSAIRQTSSAGIMYFDVGTAGTAGQFLFRAGSSFTERMRIDSSGNVGIGITSPVSRLSVVESNIDNVTVGVWNSSAYGSGNQLSRIQLGKIESATYQPMGIIQAFPDANSSSSAGSLAFHTRSGGATAERYRIGSAGQLGIGGANYGTAGQVIVSGGPSAATSWGTVGLASGGTGVSTAPAAAAVLYGYTATATAAGTTTLTNTSSQYQLFTGTTTQTVVLPVTSTLTTGWTFHIVNASTGNLTLNSSGGNLVATVIPGTTVMVTCILTSGTTAASWEYGYTDFNTLTGTGSVVMSNSPTLTTPTLGTGSFALGAVGTPSITFTGDLNTGIWSPTADTVAVSTGGIERLRIDASGNVGIATAGAQARLDLGIGTATSQTQAVLARQFGGDTNFRLAVRSGTGTTVDTEFFKLGIDYGDATPNAYLNFFRGGSTTGGFLTFSTNNNNERMRIDSAGNVGIGTSSATRTLHVRSSALVSTLLETTSASSYLDITDVSANLLRIGSFQGITGLASGATTTAQVALTPSGIMLVGKTASTIVGGGAAAQLQVNTAGIAASFVADRSDIIGGVISLGKLRSGGIVSNGDSLGTIRFAGHDGVDTETFTAQIAGVVDGTPGANTMPTAITISTGPADAINERMRIDSAGGVGIGTTANTSALLDVASTTKGFLPPRMTTTQRNAISSPATGLTVYNTTTSREETYNGVQWIPEIPLDTEEDRIINGGFDVWQRGTSSTTNGYAAADRWINTYLGGTVTQSRQSFTLGDTLGMNSPQFFLRQSVTGQTLASQWAITQQRIEGVRSYAGQTITVLGWAKRATAGNIAVEVEQSFGTGGTPSPTVYASPTTVALTTSWTPFAVTVTLLGIGGKTFGTTAGTDFLGINFWISGGTDFNARTNSLGLQTTDVDFWGIHIREGVWTANDALMYRQKSIVSEQLKCFRYYYRVTSGTVSQAVLMRGFNQSTTASRNSIDFPVRMRAIPTALEQSGTAANYAILHGATATACSAVPVFQNATEFSALVNATVAAGITAGQGSMLVSNGVTGAYLGWSAEL